MLQACRNHDQSLTRVPALRKSFAIGYSAMAPFCCASPPLVVLRLMLSETSNTWKMTTVPISAISMATSSSMRLKPRLSLGARIVRMAGSVGEDRRDGRVVVRRRTVRDLFGRAPEDLDLYGGSLPGRYRDHRHLGRRNGRAREQRV